MILVEKAGTAAGKGFTGEDSYLGQCFHCMGLYASNASHSLCSSTCLGLQLLQCCLFSQRITACLHWKWLDAQLHVRMELGREPYIVKEGVFYLKVSWSHATKIIAGFGCSMSWFLPMGLPDPAPASSSPTSFSERMGKWRAVAAG